MLIHKDELENFKPVQNETPNKIEKFANLLHNAATNLKVAKCKNEQGNGACFHKLLRKLPEKMLVC